MKIVVIEDNPQNRKLLKIIVEFMGHDCLTAEDGEAGVLLAKRENPDLILMDIQMPHMDGVTALHELRKNAITKDIPVIALTSYAMRGDRERFLQEGFDEYVEKPIDKDLLVEMIRKYG